MFFMIRAIEPILRAPAGSTRTMRTVVKKAEFMKKCHSRRELTTLYLIANGSMARAYSKSNLPSKICLVCQRSFAWRKKWADCWDDVKYCSERCRRRKSRAADSDADLTH